MCGRQTLLLSRAGTQISTGMDGTQISTDEAGVAAVNDCLYRNMMDIHYLLMIDLDEFIVPHMNVTLKDMLTFLDLRDINLKNGKKVKSGMLASSYNFKNAFFYRKNGKYVIE